MGLITPNLGDFFGGEKVGVLLVMAWRGRVN